MKQIKQDVCKSSASIFQTQEGTNELKYVNNEVNEINRIVANKRDFNNSDIKRLNEFGNSTQLRFKEIYTRMRFH